MVLPGPQVLRLHAPPARWQGKFLFYLQIHSLFLLFCAPDFYPAALRIEIPPFIHALIHFSTLPPLSLSLEGEHDDRHSQDV